METTLELPGGHRLTEDGQVPQNGTPAKRLERIVTLREMTGEEEDILTDQQRAPGGRGVILKRGTQRISEILSHCTVSIGDIKRPDGKTDEELPDYFVDHWKYALAGDRGFATVRLRQMTLGDEFIFSKTCPSCGKEIKRINVDLSTLEQSAYFEDVEDPEEKQRLLLCDVHTVKLPRSGQEVRYRLMTGIEEDEFSQLNEQRPNSPVTSIIFIRIISIDGKPPTYKQVQKLKGGDRMFLRSLFQKNEGGLKLRVPIICDNPTCRAENTTVLEVASTDFFFPSETS